jgi:hypothetical protein
VGSTSSSFCFGLTEFQDKLPAAIEAGQPPDVAQGINIDGAIPEWLLSLRH